MCARAGTGGALQLDDSAWDVIRKLAPSELLVFPEVWEMLRYCVKLSGAEFEQVSHATSLTRH